MRDALYITGLMAAVFLLAADFPVGAADPGSEPPARAPFASFAELPPALHAACLEAAKTSWQVRSGSRARPVIGSLDAGVPLLNAVLPPADEAVFTELSVDRTPAGEPGTDVYSLLPESAGVDYPMFTARPAGNGALRKPELPFPREAMLSTDDFKKLKEIVK